MKILLKTLFLALTLTFFSCSNGSDSEPCLPIACLNGGISTIDCDCDCPEGYTGTDCSIQVTPSKIKITKITLIGFPLMRDSNDYWDSYIFNQEEVSPDIFIRIRTTSEILYTSGYYENAISSFSGYDFIPDTPISITSPTSPIGLSVNDNDKNLIGDDTYELMVYSAFGIYDDTNGFPSVLKFDHDNPVLQFDLHLTYEF